MPVAWFLLCSFAFIARRQRLGVAHCYPDQYDRETTSAAGSRTGSTLKQVFVILHKLMEELLTGQLQGGVPEIEGRTLELLGQLGIKPVDDVVADTVVRTINLPEVARLRPLLVPEYSVFGHRTTAKARFLFLALPMPLPLIGRVELTLSLIGRAT